MLVRAFNASYHFLTAQAQSRHRGARSAMASAMRDLCKTRVLALKTHLLSCGVAAHLPLSTGHYQLPVKALSVPSVFSVDSKNQQQKAATSGEVTASGLLLEQFL